MSQFIFNNTTRVLFGAGQLNNLHAEKLPGAEAHYMMIGEVIEL